MRGGGWRAAHFSVSAGTEFCACGFGTITPKKRLHGSVSAGTEFCACRYGTMREVFGGTGSRFARNRRGRAAWEPRRPASPRAARPCALATPFRRGRAHYAFPSSPAVRAGDPVSKGPCALVAAVSAHGPSGTALPVRTARPRPSLQCARHTVGAGACGLGKVPGARRPRARPPAHECSPPACRRNKTAGRGEPPAAPRAHVNRRGAIPVHECSENG